MNPIDTKRRIMGLATDAGFERCGVASANAVERGAYYRDWLNLGRAGSMDYLHRNVDERLDASKLLPGAKSVIVCALNYHQSDSSKPNHSDGDRANRGRVAMYAWGDDYHKVIKKKLFAIVDQLRSELPEPFEAKACVDTVPILEREYAARAGIGWIGKNTLVMNETLGSYFFLGLIVTTLELEPDEPSPDHCGSCTRCLDACPTDAFPEPYQMDASRCISYLTIEHRAETISPELRPLMGEWVFGCDVCQEVCPHNRSAPNTNEPRFKVKPPSPNPNLSDLVGWSDEAYRDALRGSPIKRAKPAMLRRNALIAQINLASLGE